MTDIQIVAPLSCKIKYSIFDIACHLERSPENCCKANHKYMQFADGSSRQLPNRMKRMEPALPKPRLTITTVFIMIQRKKGKWQKVTIAVIILLIFSPVFLLSQNSKDSLLGEVTIKSAIDYAIVRQPIIQQSLVDQEILETTIRSKLADWYPQINFNYILQHNFIVQTAVIGGNSVKLGVNNTSAGQFTFSQSIFDKDVFLANRTQTDVRLQARQITSNNKIDLAANVSKAFYDVLSTMQQIKVSATNIVRIERSLKDALNQYQAGITDKIDYKRATITLNNTRAAKKSNEELLKAKLEYLKSLMGYPAAETLNIVYDSLQMEREIALDTLQKPNYSSRIEFQLLETRKRLLQYN
ncbi:MAG: TolC family protein, partial [Ferruginibacter sp.]